MADPFEKYRRLQGKMDITVSGDVFTIVASLDDKKEFVRLSDAKEKGKLDGGYDAFFTYAKKLLKQSYPDQPEQVMDDFLKLNSNVFFDELMIGFGFITREKLKEAYAAKFAAATGTPVEKKNDARGLPSAVPDALQHR